MSKGAPLVLSFLAASVFAAGVVPVDGGFAEDEDVFEVTTATAAPSKKRCA